MTGWVEQLPDSVPPSAGRGHLRRLAPSVPRARPWQAIVVVISFGVVFALRIGAWSDASPLGELYLIPILLAAWWLGVAGAAVAVSVALGLVAGWGLWLGGDVSPSGYGIRAGVFVAVGASAGATVDRLARSVTSWEALVRSSPDAVLGVDRTGRITDASDTAARLFGVPEEQLVGRSVDMLVPEELREAHRDHLAGYWSHPQFRPMFGGRTMQALLPNHEHLQVRISLAPVVRRSGIAVLATVRDVSEQQRTLEQLQESELRFRGAIETMLDPFIIVSPVRERGSIVDFKVDFANAAAQGAHGLATAAEGPLTLRNLSPAIEYDQLFDRFASVAITGVPIELTEVSFEGSAAGERRIVDLHATRLGDRVASTWRDVTAQVRARAEIRQAAHQLEAAFDHAPTGVAMVSTDLVIRRANEAFSEMLRVPPGTLVGRSLAEITRSAHEEEALRGLTQLAAGSAGTAGSAGSAGSYRAEVRLVDSYGQLVWVILSAARVPDELDRPGYLIVHAENISARREYEERLVHMASHDALTGLLNRRQFIEDLEHHLALNARYGGGGALILLDLDNFKYVNDTLGHAAGDEVVRGIAANLGKRLRSTDRLARLGGDEFAVLAPVADETGARHLAESLLSAAREGAGTGAVTGRVRTSSSAGVVLLGTERLSAVDLLARADMAMYAAKNEGRDRFVVFDSRRPDLVRWQARFRWIDRIRDALETGKFALHAQPMVDVSAGGPSHYELLLRMRSEGHLVPAGRFLHIAEQHGLAPAVDRWVIQEAIALVARYPGPAGRRFGINLSAESLGDADLPEVVRSTLRHFAVDPRRLIFEVTETAAISNFAAAQAFMEHVTDMGCGFALDDFGAGYGSFYNLKHLPLQYLKIDGEFIRQLPSNPTDQLIVQAILRAARGMGKKTVAEYVTDQATLDLLREYGVDYAQGYHIGRPMDLARIFSASETPHDQPGT